MTTEVEKNLKRLNITLPDAAAPAANYLPYNFSCGQLYISGQLPKDISGKTICGQLGKEVTLEEGVKAAKVAGINLIAQMRAALNGDLTRVKKIVKITCYVNSELSFHQQPAVANGCSDLLVDVFGPEVGRHARCAVGVAQLPFNVAV